MKWLKSSLYLILFTVVGVVYLSFVDNWQIYATPLAEVKAWYQRTVQGETEPAFSGSVVVQDQNFEDDLSLGEGQTAREDQTVGEDESLDEVESVPVSQDGDGQSDEGTAEGEMPVDNGDDANEEGDGFGDGSDPVYMTVEDDYFADAVFIGDSRTMGMYEYGGLEEVTTFYASKGLTIYKLFSAEVVEVPGERKKKSIEEALQENQFKKIYLMVGINEMGTGTVDTFAEAYGEVVERLLELQPDAILYIQGILKVTTERSGKGDYINNEGIVARNEAIAQLADNRRVFYLDANPLLCDNTGGLEPSYTFDGVHLKAQYVEIWKDYLKEHAVKLE